MCRSERLVSNRFGVYKKNLTFAEAFIELLL